MNEQDLRVKGEALRRQLVGDERFEHSGKTTYADPVMKEFIDLATVSIFGAIWSRPGLDLKTRTLVCCISDAATGRFEELDIHLQMALRMGWQRIELQEALLQLMGYVGAPLTRDVMKTLAAVFKRADEGRPSLT